jgi:hypothetical protein
VAQSIDEKEAAIHDENRASDDLLCLKVEQFIRMPVDQPSDHWCSLAEWFQQLGLNRGEIVRVLEVSLWRGASTSIADWPRILKMIRLHSDDWPVRDERTKRICESGLSSSVASIHSYGDIRS